MRGQYGHSGVEHTNVVTLMWMSNPNKRSDPLCGKDRHSFNRNLFIACKLLELLRLVMSWCLENTVQAFYFYMKIHFRNCSLTSLCILQASITLVHLHFSLFFFSLFQRNGHASNRLLEQVFETVAKLRIRMLNARQWPLKPYTGERPVCWAIAIALPLSLLKPFPTSQYIKAQNLALECSKKISSS